MLLPQSREHRIELGNLMVIASASLISEAKEFIEDIEEPTMYNLEQETRQYLKSRTIDVDIKKDKELRKHFNQEYQYPKDYQQALDWEKRGGMKVKVFNDHCYDDYDQERNFGWDVQWINPDKPKDDEGYKASRKLLTKAHTATQDIIMVSNPEDGLKAVQEFEARTFH